MLAEFKNPTLNKDLKELISNLDNLEISLGKVSGHSIEVFDKTNQSQGSYIYGKNIKNRDTDYQTLLEVIEFNLVN
jgi:hypothetical protein